MSQERRPSPTLRVAIRSAIFATSSSAIGVDGDEHADRHAPLARRAEARVDRGVRGEVEVGIRQHEHVVLRAAERLHPLAVLRRLLVDVPGDRGGADEGDGCDVRVLDERVDRDLVAVHDVEDAVGQAGLGEQLGHPVGRGRVLLRGLQDDGVARRDRDREEPQRHHRREVERADDADDAERLAGRVDVDAGRHVLAVLALHEVRDAGRELDDLEAAGDLAHRIREHLAVLRREDARELFRALVEQLAEPEDDPLALREGGVRPGGEGGLGRGDGDVHVADRGEAHLLLHGAASGVVYGGGARRFAFE